MLTGTAFIEARQKIRKNARCDPETTRTAADWLYESIDTCQ